jgi:hypothetical protein
MFIRLPAIAAGDGEVRAAGRLVRVSRPDTISGRLRSLAATSCGFQPHAQLAADGDFAEQLLRFCDAVRLQIMVDVVQPDAMQQTLKALDK